MNWKIVLVYCITAALCPVYLMGQDLKQLPGQYSNMVYRQADGKLYALRYSSTDNTQYLDRIDPLFARVEEAYPVNAASGILALSDNQAYLYMGTPDSILRYSFASQAVDLRFAHQLNTNQVVYPREIRTLPNQPDAVAVLWNYGYYAETYLVLYDQGVRRPKVVSAVYDIATFTALEHRWSKASMSPWRVGKARSSRPSSSLAKADTSSSSWLCGASRYFGRHWSSFLRLNCWKKAPTAKVSGTQPLSGLCG